MTGAFYAQNSFERTKGEQEVNFCGNLMRVKKHLFTLYEVRFPDKKLPYDPFVSVQGSFMGHQKFYYIVIGYVNCQSEVRILIKRKDCSYGKRI